MITAKQPAWKTKTLAKSSGRHREIGIHYVLGRREVESRKVGCGGAVIPENCRSVADDGMQETP